MPGDASIIHGKLCSHIAPRAPHGLPPGVLSARFSRSQGRSFSEGPELLDKLSTCDFLVVSRQPPPYKDGIG